MRLVNRRAGMAVLVLLLVASIGGFFAVPTAPNGLARQVGARGLKATRIGLPAVRTVRSGPGGGLASARVTTDADAPRPPEAASTPGTVLAKDLTRGLARGIGPSLELVVGELDSVGPGGGRSDRNGGGKPRGKWSAGELGPANAPGDDTFWPDSSSPVRNAPSNSTTGPDQSALPKVPGWTLAKVNLTSGVRQRYYLVARPAVVTASKLPVLLVLPGRNMTPATIVRASGVLGSVGQAVVVFPAGFANSWNAGYCCGVAHLAGVDDVAFVEQVVRNVLATQPGASAAPVFITGFSNGGRMALDMACADPGAFAGVAAVEAVAVSSCIHADPVPLLEVASTADPILTISASAPPKHIAGHVEVTVQALVQHWRAMDGCEDPGVTTSYQGMTLTEWAHCRGRGRVAVAIYAGGRHAWPRGRARTPSAETLIWDFFHARPAPSRVDRSA